jgi:HlyD family secretion protein
MTSLEAAEWHRGVSADLRGPTILGVVFLVVCLGGFALWAATAPLSGAVVVSGSFVATGQNKLVQHLEGGILLEMFVKEGDRVEANQSLLRLDATAAQSRLRRLIIRRNRLLITTARLEAELRGETSFVLPAILAKGAEDPEVQGMFDRQRIELRARRTKVTAEEEVLRKEIAGLLESINGHSAQSQSTKERLALFSEELQDKKALFARQLARKSEVLSLQRSEAALSGELGEVLARTADAKERIARAEQQIAQLQSAASQKAVEELRTTETELDDVNEQMRAAEDVVRRTEVVAPVRGVVVKVHQHTIGGVIPAGGVIAELLPLNDELILEARLNPGEIAHVREGQLALVKLTALNQRVTPMIDGRVRYLSADTVTTQFGARSKAEPESAVRPSYIVRVQLDREDTVRKLGQFTPTPGMPADVFIRTGERTFFNYVMRPIWDSFSRAFREH